MRKRTYLPSKLECLNAEIEKILARENVLRKEITTIIAEIEGVTV